MWDGCPDGRPDTRARRNRPIPSPEPEYGRTGSAARARVAQALFALFAGSVAGIARRLLLRFQRPGSLLLLGLHRGLLEELGLMRCRRRGLAIRLTGLAGDANLHQGGLPLREVLVRFRLGAKLFEQGLAGFRGICLAVQAFGLFLEAD